MWLLRSEPRDKCQAHFLKPNKAFTVFQPRILYLLRVTALTIGHVKSDKNTKYCKGHFNGMRGEHKDSSYPVLYMQISAVHFSD